MYGPGTTLFVGVELDEIPKPDLGLEHKSINFPKYAYYKHIGPYNLIKQIGEAMHHEIKNKGFEVTLLYVEIYGHWTHDESKLETELFVGLK